ERHLRRVDGVVLPVDETDGHALHRRAGELAVEHRLLDPFVDGRAEALRNDTADDLVLELVALVARPGLDDDLAVAELAAAARLLLVPGPSARLLADRLQVGDARLVQLHLDAEAAPEPLDGDLDMHLRQPGEQLLARLLVAAELERRVLFGEPSQ